MRPVIDELKTSIKVYEFDIDLDQDVASRMAVKTLPTTIVMSNGQVLKTFEGSATLEQIQGSIGAKTKTKPSYDVFGVL